MNNAMLGQLGGVFALLVFWHFVADWVFQSHKEAMAKTKSYPVLMWHCIKYATMFVPAFLWLGWRWDSMYMAVAWSTLYLSHYVIDSYVPVMLWAKHLRKAPQFADVVLGMPGVLGSVTLTKEQHEQLLANSQMFVTGSVQLLPGTMGGVWAGPHEVKLQPWPDRVTYPSDADAFAALAATPLGVVLMVTIDQLMHVAFLLPIAWLVVTHS